MKGRLRQSEPASWKSASNVNVIRGHLKALHQPVPSIRLVCRCTNHLKLLSLREDRHVSFFSPAVLDLPGLSLTALPKGLSCDCNQMMAKAGRHKAFLTRMP